MKISGRDLKAYLLMVPAFFFILLGYEFIRSPSVSLFQHAYGSEKQAFALGFLPLLLLATVYVYNHLLSRLGPKLTMVVSSALSFFAILSCFIFVDRFKPAAFFLFIFREVYIVLVLEQFWSFINSSVSEQGARKFNGVLAGLAGIGGVAGGFFVKNFAKEMGTTNLLLVAAGSIIPACMFAFLAYKYCGEPAPEKRSLKSDRGSSFGMGEFRQSPILIYLFLLVLASQSVSTVLGIGFQTEMYLAFPEIDAQTAYAGGFYANMNFYALVFQFLACPLLLWLFSAGSVQIFIPLVHIVMGLIYLLHPSLGTAGMAFMVFKVLDYSIFRASKEVLYIPLSFDARYRVKELIDIFGYRLGKGVISLLVFGLQNVASMRILNPVGALVSAGCWAMVALPLVWQGKIKRKTAPLAAAKS